MWNRPTPGTTEYRVRLKVWEGGGGVEAGLTRFWYGSQKCEWEGEEVSEKTTPYGKSGPWTPETPRPTLCK